MAGLRAHAVIGVLVWAFVACRAEPPPAGSCLPGAKIGEDTPWWYSDTDEDGFGDPADGKQACHQPDGYVEDMTDCDDTDAEISPDGIEVCGGADQNCDGANDEEGALGMVVSYADADGDGYGSTTEMVEACDVPYGYLSDNTDCDDAVAEVNPLGIEVCNGADDDCDGALDDADPDVSDGLVWYSDVDGDGFGNAAMWSVACEAPELTSADSSDCNDAEPLSYPGGLEVCDGVDNDCNGLTDETTTEAPTWYVDGDGDGYGSTALTAVTCLQPPGYTTNADDCDDGSIGIYPGAVEICDNADGDCDGIVDNNASDALPWYVDVDLDGYGDPTNIELSCTQPTDATDWDLALDCNDGDAAINPDATEVCEDSVDQDCDTFERLCPLADSVVIGEGIGDVWSGKEHATRAGESIAWAGDTDQDGYDEVLVGAFFESSVAAFAGAAFIVNTYGVGQQTLDTAAAMLTGEEINDGAGESASAAGDVNGDGYPDILVGAYRRSESAEYAGQVYLVNGPITSKSLGDADAKILGEKSDDQLGTSVAGLGDLNADGFDDIAMGAANNADNVTLGGAVYVFYGPVSGTLSASVADARLFGASESEEAGRSVSGGGDVNADGQPDFVIGGDHAYSGAGVAYLMLTAPSGDAVLDTADASFQGEADGDELGYSVSIVGDTNNDGYDDLLLGAMQSSHTDTQAGAAYLVLGPVYGAFDLSGAEAALYGELGGDNTGSDVSSGGDYDGDHRTDFLVGAWGNDEAGTTGGAAYLVLSPMSGSELISDVAYAKFIPHCEVTEMGHSVDGGGDIDGDGLPDYLMGAPDYGYLQGGSGAAFVVRGSEF